MKLLEQQQKALIKTTNNKVGALFMKMGTGKTRVAVEWVNSIQKNIDLVIYIAPLGIIRPKNENVSSVSDEINKWGGFNSKNTVYFGIESIGMSDRIYLEVFNLVQSPGRCVIIVDESIKMKNSNSKRTQRLIELSRMVEYKLILNGEPITRDLIDLWAQIQFLDPRILRMDEAEFKNTFCKYTTITKRIPGRYTSYKKEFITGYENIDYLYSLIGEYVYECDLELNIQQLFTTSSYSLTREEKEEYSFLKEKYLDNELLQLKNNNIFLELTQKMQHSYCTTKEKFFKVDEWIIDEGKTIIFCKYIRSMEECQERYPRALVLNYKSGSYGLNLQDRPYTVYFDQTWDWGDVVQSSHRNYRQGQQEDCRYLQLVGDVGLEKLIKKNNNKKVDMSEYLKKVSIEQLKKEL